MPLVDVHAHFHHPAGARADWAERNASRLDAGERIGITAHVASILGSWGRTSPTYFPSRRDVVTGNDALLALMREHPARIHGYACVNPNYTAHALGEIARCLDARHDRHQARGQPARRRSAARSDRDAARTHRVPILQHVWQHRRGSGRDRRRRTARSSASWPGAIPRSRSSSRTSAAAATGPTRWRSRGTIDNVFVDLSGSGVDGGMLESCLDGRGRGQAALGLRPHDGHRLGQAPLPGAHRERGRSRSRSAGGTPPAIFPAGAFDRHEPAGSTSTPSSVSIPSGRCPTARRMDSSRAMDRDRDRQRVGLAPDRDLLGRSDVGERGPLPDRGRSPRLRPVPAVHPRTRRMERAGSTQGTGRGAPAVRADPTRWWSRPAGVRRWPSSPPRAGRSDFPLLLSVRLEDGRQRHPRDSSLGTRAVGRPGPHPERSVGAADRDPRRSRLHRAGALRRHARRGVAYSLGHLLDLGTAGGSPRRCCSRRSGSNASSSAPGCRFGFPNQRREAGSARPDA